MAANRIHNIPQFYESLTLRVVVSFKPKLKDREPKPEFDLVLGKKWTYDQACRIFLILFDIYTS